MTRHAVNWSATMQVGGGGGGGGGRGGRGVIVGPDKRRFVCNFVTFSTACESKFGLHFKLKSRL